MLVQVLVPLRLASYLPEPESLLSLLNLDCVRLYAL